MIEDVLVISEYNEYGCEIIVRFVILSVIWLHSFFSNTVNDCHR